MRRRRLLRLVAVAGSVAALAAGTLPAQQGTVRTDAVWSQALGTTKQLVVYLPPSYATPAGATRRYPVAVYLHGYFGSERDWTVAGALAATMDSLVAAGLPEMIVVMPDGDDGWWTTWHRLIDVSVCRRTPRQENADTYCVPWLKYDDYVAADIVTWTDTHYRTLAQRASRAIAGLSMGGYGAISLAARFPQTFAVAASHSGVLRPALMTDSSTVATTGRATERDARTRDELRAASGARWERIEAAFGQDSVSWMSRDPARLLQRLRDAGTPLPALYVDVGTEDYLLPMNRSFRETMAQMQVPLAYAEYPGRHDWAYWKAHLSGSLRFIGDHLVTR